MSYIKAEAITTLAPYGSAADALINAVRTMSTRQA